VYISTLMFSKDYIAPQLFLPFSLSLSIYIYIYIERYIYIYIYIYMRNIDRGRDVYRLVKLNPGSVMWSKIDERR